MVRVRRGGVPILLVMFLMCAVELSAQSRTRPPSGLRLVGDHYTPYDPPDPAAFPPGSKVHTIVRGDTLWDLAARYYGNAYLWPQLWEANTYITDAHWIYPGDPLLIEGETSMADVPETTAISSGETPAGDASEAPPVTAQVATAGGSPIALGNESDVYCYGYLGAEDEPMPNRIVSFEDEETKYSVGSLSQDIGVAVDEIVFVEGGTSTGIMPGNTYLVVKAGEIVAHPETEEVVGRHYDYRGQVRILCATETTATAIVTQSCSDIHIGDSLRPLPQIPIPVARLTDMANICTAPSGKATGYIVNAKDFRYSLGEGNVVEINLGRDDFVQPGDFLTVYRDSRIPGNPRQVLGEIGVLTAEARTATAKVVRMRYSMEVGDRVEVK